MFPQILQYETWHTNGTMYVKWKEYTADSLCDDSTTELVNTTDSVRCPQSAPLPSLIGEQDATTEIENKSESVSSQPSDPIPPVLVNSDDLSIVILPPTLASSVIIISSDDESPPQSSNPNPFTCQVDPRRRRLQLKSSQLKLAKSNNQKNERTTPKPAQ